MGLQKINWTQIDSENVPDNKVVNIGKLETPIKSLYAENLYITGTSIGDLFVNNGTYSGGTLVLSSNSGQTITITGLTSNDIYVTGATFENNRLTLHKNDSTSVYVDIDNFSGLTVNGVVSASTFYGNSILGEPEDVDYSDGLFTDISNDTYVGVFADRVNEVLKSLAPTPAPPLTSISLLLTGVNGKMSFNNLNKPLNYYSIDGIGNLTPINFDGTYNVTTNRYGIFGLSLSTISGLLASNVSVGTGSPTPAYPANAFGDADQGTLELYVNDNFNPIHTVNLIEFNNGNTFNNNNSGFNLSSPTSIKFPMGNGLDLYKYRTGTWVISNSDIRNGWNFVRVVHRIDSTVRSTQYIDFFRDNDFTTTLFTNESLSNLILSGLKYLSGVKYYTGGNVIYDITVNNAYLNAYSNSSTAISYNNNSTNLIVPTSEPLPSSNNDVNKTLFISKNIGIVNSGIRILNGLITLRTTILRTVQSTATSPGATINGLLVDNVNSTSTTLVENFDDESYRLPSNVDFDIDPLLPSLWDSTSLINDSGNDGYKDGLLVYNGQLSYPNQNFSTIVYGPENNVNYSTNVTGERTYYRFFVKSGTSNFILNVSGNGTIRNNDFIMSSFSDDIKMDIKLPNSNNLGTGWMDVSQTFATDQWTDGSGCLLSGEFNFNTNNNLTVGTRNTSNSGVGDKIIIRIRVPQNWNGSLNTITLT